MSLFLPVLLKLFPEYNESLISDPRKSSGLIVALNLAQSGPQTSMDECDPYGVWGALLFVWVFPLGMAFFKELVGSHVKHGFSHLGSGSLG